MTSLSRQKTLEKLENFKEYLKYLRQLREEIRNEEDFLEDFHQFGNVERYLQLSIQIIVDVSHLIIIDLGLERPEDNYEAISILFKQKIISESLAQKLTKMVGLRNILVHEYGKIDRKKIYSVLKEQLDDLENFKTQIINYLKK